MRTERSFLIESPSVFEEKLFEWSKTYDSVVWLDSNSHQDKYSNFHSALAISSHTGQSEKVLKTLDELQNFITQKQDWLFGYLTYDIKNELEDLESNNYDGLHFSDLAFFQPDKVITVRPNSVTFAYLDDIHEIEKDFNAIQRVNISNPTKSEQKEEVKISIRVKKDEYFAKAARLLEHIHRGDVYEVNFCQEFFAENTQIDPWHTYQKLNSISKPPFATFLKLDEYFLMSASPERYLLRKNNKIISQPIKGTAARSEDEEEDMRMRKELQTNIKERAENIMIADLVRNDLSKSALKGSVDVEELCTVYSFEQVHQMISTITCAIKEEKNSIDVIRETFPMGSMTGAPKVSAMKLIETYEETKRGLYSGAVGYFAPNGDFDFNVVIRSILYNSQRRYVSYSVGSAITAKSNPEQEYQECLLKAKALRRVLESH